MPTINEQLAEVSRQLAQADITAETQRTLDRTCGGGSGHAVQIGHLILAISTLADAVERLAAEREEPRQ